LNIEERGKDMQLNAKQKSDWQEVNPAAVNQATGLVRQ